VSWVAGPEPVTAQDFQRLVQLRVNWIVQTPFGWQDRFDSPEVRLVTEGRIFWGETDAGLETTTRLARQAGIKTLIKPHVWLRNREKWRTEIGMRNEADWQRWFASYRKLILHYAEFAERTGIEALSVGTELHRTAVEREDDWRRLIKEVRGVYRGQLTYAANWYKEFEEIRFWDALDLIGIQAYFPLTAEHNPSVEQLKAAWEPHLKAIEAVQHRFGKPVVFTEIGYKSTPDAAIEPWVWKRPSKERSTPEGLQTQANGYEAFFQAAWSKEWLAGVYWWKWWPRPATRVGPSFTPQNKPAEQVLATWYSK